MEALPNAKRQLFFLGCLILLSSSFGWTQAKAPVTVPTGFRPLGIAAIGDYVAVANSGEDSVSIFQINPEEQPHPLTLLVTVTGVPSPFGVFRCGLDDSLQTDGARGGTVLVTSPEENSVRVLKVPEGQILGTVSTGLQPHSAGCFRGAFSSIGPPLTAVVSNAGDSSLTFFEIATLETTQVLQGVPGSRGFGGVTTITTSGFRTYITIAGTEAGVVSRAGLDGIGQQYAISHPIRAFLSSNAGALTIASAEGDGLDIVRVSALNEAFEIRTLEAFPNVPNPRDVLSIDNNAGRGWVATTGDSLWTYFSGIEQVYPGIPEATAMAIIYRPPPTDIGTPVLLVTSPESNEIFAFCLPYNRPSTRLPVQSAASVRTAAAGSLASAFLSDTGVSEEFQAGSLPLPTTLGGVSVSVGGSWSFDWVTGQWNYLPGSGTAAGLLYVGPTQINFQIPPGIPQGMMVTQIQKPDGSSEVGMVDVVTTSPSIFTASQDGQGQAAALNQDNSVNSVSNPAPRGSVLQLYLTGAGPTDPPLAPGEAADPFGDPLVLTQTEPTVTINARPARMLFSGMAPGYVGLWQINVEIPADTPPGPPVPLQVTAEGRSSNIVTIAVQ